MDDLKLYFVVFDVHEGRQWTANACYVFARNSLRIHEIFAEKYGQVLFRDIIHIKANEGTTFYGQRWRADLTSKEINNEKGADAM